MKHIINPLVEWVDENDSSWRFKRWFAWRPQNTHDAGWVWLRFFWRYQKSWGWGFWDDWPYAKPDCPLCWAGWSLTRQGTHRGVRGNNRTKLEVRCTGV